MSIVDKDLTTIAFCWRVERRDGVAIGFTTHDRDLAIGHLTYRAAPGMLPSAIALSDGFDPDTLDVKGALTSDTITVEDLATGRWDGAAVSIFMVDWEAPEDEQVPIARGELGDVSIEGKASRPNCAGRRRCSIVPSSSRRRRNAGPSWATKGAASTWRHGCGSRGS